MNQWFVMRYNPDTGTVESWDVFSHTEFMADCETIYKAYSADEITSVDCQQQITETAYKYFAQNNHVVATVEDANTQFNFSVYEQIQLNLQSFTNELIIHMENKHGYLIG